MKFEQRLKKTTLSTMKAEELSRDETQTELFDIIDNLMRFEDIDFEQYDDLLELINHEQFGRVLSSIKSKVEQRYPGVRYAVIYI